MFRYVVVLALFALAAATPVAKTESDLKSDNTFGLGYAGLYGVGVGPLTAGVNPYIRSWGARSLWNGGAYPYTTGVVNPAIINPAIYNPGVWNPAVVDPWW